MRPIQRRQQGIQYGIYLLALQAVNFGVDKIPPATLIGIIGQVSFLHGSSLFRICIYFLSKTRELKLMEFQEANVVVPNY